MFGSKHKMRKTLRMVNSFIGAGDMSLGSIVYSGGIQISGRMCGDLEPTKSEKSNCNEVHIAKLGNIDGKIRADHVIIEGRVRGNITADTILIEKTANVQGTLTFNMIQIAPGARVAGELVEQTEKV